MDPRPTRVAARLDAPDCLPRWTPSGATLPVKRLPEAPSMVTVAALLIRLLPSEIGSPARRALAPSLSSSRPEPGVQPCSPRRPTSQGAAARTESGLAEGDTSCSALTPDRAIAARLRCPRRTVRRGRIPSSAVPDLPTTPLWQSANRSQFTRHRSRHSPPPADPSTVRTTDWVRTCVQRHSKQWHVIRGDAAHDMPACAFSQPCGPLKTSSSRGGDRG